ncbi:MAG TPA: DUF4412 domain-containing protein [Candidatus Binataceae bacterium]|jgi:hypothetical protein|nr:DUF4412 domain-containing protein [Candidatus Binataceae bacterium]
MKKYAAAFAALVIFAGSGIARAGVVVTEQEVIDQGNGKPVTRNRTVMIQGNKQKMVTERAQVVTDLDTGKMFLMNPEKKQYVEVPFPPSGAMAQMMNQKMSTLSFKKTGASKTINGYACEEYTGAGSMMGNDYKVSGCFSTKAPGATDFDTFQKTMANKVKGTAMAMQGEVPDGVPIELDSTTKMTNFSMPGMSPDQASKLKQMFANRPPVVSKTTVTQIASKDLPGDTFAVPAGFSKQQMPSGPMGGPAPGGPPPPPAASKVPQ